MTEPIILAYMTAGFLMWVALAALVLNDPNSRVSGEDTAAGLIGLFLTLTIWPVLLYTLTAAQKSE